MRNLLPQVAPHRIPQMSHGRSPTVAQSVESTSPGSPAWSSIRELTREKLLRVRPVRQGLLPEVALILHQEDAHGRETLPVWQGLLTELLPPHPREDPHGQEALTVLRGRREDLHPGGEPPPDTTGFTPGRSCTDRVRQGFHHEIPSTLRIETLWTL